VSTSILLAPTVAPVGLTGYPGVSSARTFATRRW
jgi:hypothetical protein